MKFPLLLAPAFVALLFAAGANAVAQDNVLPEPTTRAIAVLVKVNRHGSIASMSPDVTLQPALRKLLRQTLQRMITQPAHDANGKPVASEMVMQLSLHATQLPDGTYKSAFMFLSAKAIPTGQWVWKFAHQGDRPSLIREGDVGNLQNERAKNLRRFKANHGIQGPISQQKRRSEFSQHTSPMIHGA